MIGYTDGDTITEQYIEQNYTNAYPARFFANVEKINEIINYLDSELQN